MGGSQTIRPCRRKVVFRSDTPNYKLRTSTLLAPCTVAGCTETDVCIYHTKYLQYYLELLGTALVKRDTRWGSFSAVRKLMSSRRIPLCTMHLNQMNQGELMWSYLFVTEQFTKAIHIVEGLI